MQSIERILIIEDSKFFNNLLKKNLSEIAKDIKQIYSFSEAEAILENEDFDYIFLDLILPDGEGDELIELLPLKIRNKTIVLTSDEDAERREHIFKLGVLEYFSKLNPMDLIVNDIKKLLNSLESNKNYNILIVDDSSFVRKTIKNILKPRRYNLLFAEDAEKAENILNNNFIHLILLDIELPFKNGMEFLEDIRKNNKFVDIPVIPMSSNDDPIIVSRLLRHGAQDFIKKPFIAEYLVLKCDIYLRSYKNLLLLEEKNEQVNKLTRLKSEFVSNISHEIRTPLNSINGFIKLLSYMDLPQEAKKYVNILNITVDDLLKIVNDLLDLEKIENNKLEIENIEFNLKKELDILKEIYIQRSQDSGVIFEYEFKNIDKNIISDPTRIRQIVNNLLTNSFKFTPKNNHIYLIVEIKNNKLFIQIKDEGIGIEKDKLKDIFKPFVQANTNISRKYGGTGLGLGVVKSIVDLFNGKIKVDSEFGKWTEIDIEFPIKISLDKKLNILVAEDDESNQAFIEAILKHLGHKYKIVSNGQQAIDEFKKDKFDVVILDEYMPIFSGSEVLKQIKTINPNIKSISISGTKDVDGYDYILSKPFSIEKVDLALKEIYA